MNNEKMKRLQDEIDSCWPEMVAGIDRMILEAGDFPENLEMLEVQMPAGSTSAVISMDGREAVLVEAPEGLLDVPVNTHVQDFPEGMGAMEILVRLVRYISWGGLWYNFHSAYDHDLPGRCMFHSVGIPRVSPVDDDFVRVTCRVVVYVPHPQEDE